MSVPGTRISEAGSEARSDGCTSANRHQSGQPQNSRSHVGDIDGLTIRSGTTGIRDGKGHDIRTVVVWCEAQTRSRTRCKRAPILCHAPGICECASTRCCTGQIDRCPLWTTGRRTNDAHARRHIYDVDCPAVRTGSRVIIGDSQRHNVTASSIRSEVQG